MIVEDEKSIAGFIKAILNSNGYDAMVAQSGGEALTMISSHCPDLVILNLGLPDMNGTEIITKVRSWTQLPIIVVSARGTEQDKVSALELGADDYITKPFSIREVVARIGVVLRRFEKPQSTAMVFRTLTVDPVAKTVTVDGAPVLLTRIEFELLCCLLESRGRVLSRQDLISRVWPKDEVVLDRTVDVNITRLRKKIGPYASCIRTRSGYGYFFGE